MALKERFDIFREHHVPSDGEDVLWTLRRLENDDRMAQAWNSLDKQSPTVFYHVLRCILEAKWNADNFALYPTTKARLDARHARLLDSVSTLREFFAALNTPEVDAPEVFNSIKETNQKTRECIESLKWAQSYIERRSEVLSKAMQRDTPVSQKRSSPQVAFGILLCKAINDKLGQPLYSFVATVTAVVYQINENQDIAAEAIRKAFKRDQEKRAVS